MVPSTGFSNGDMRRSTRRPLRSSTSMCLCLRVPLCVRAASCLRRRRRRRWRWRPTARGRIGRPAERRAEGATDGSEGGGCGGGSGAPAAGSAAEPPRRRCAGRLGRGNLGMILKPPPPLPGTPGGALDAAAPTVTDPSVSMFPVAVTSSPMSPATESGTRGSGKSARRGLDVLMRNKTTSSPP